MPDKNDSEFPDSEPHPCHFCGDYVNNGLDSRGDRHYLSDCRPDLVEHEVGKVCTWHNLEDKPFDCYAYQNHRNLKWTNSHEHFYTDGPM